MKSNNIQIRVGAFFLIGLVLLATMVVLFSKGMSFGSRTYKLYMSTPNVGGLKKGAAVLLAGVPVGRVSNINLNPDSTEVIVTLQISKNVKIHSDARFVIEQSGFLGDQYVCVIPTENAAPHLKDGDRVQCEPPFNLLETARNTAGFISRMDVIAKKLDQTILEIKSNLLNIETLTNVANTIALMHEAAVNARDLTLQMRNFLSNNSPSFQTTISNLNYAANQINNVAGTINSIAETSLLHVTNILATLDISSRTLREILDEIQKGQGLVSKLLNDPSLSTHISLIASNAAITTSNINSLGLWRVLWRPRPSRTNAAPPRAAFFHYNQLRVGTQ